MNTPAPTPEALTQRLHEISRFVRQTVRALPQEESRWFYVDGQFPEN